MKEFASNAQDKLQGMSTKAQESMDNVKSQLMTYNNQIQEHLNKINTEVQDYKFVVEKKGNDTVIDVAFKVTVSKKN